MGSPALQADSLPTELSGKPEVWAGETNKQTNRILQRTPSSDVLSLLISQEEILEKEMATHSGILAWRIPWTEETDGLQSMGPQSRTRLKRMSSDISRL